MSSRSRFVSGVVVALVAVVLAILFRMALVDPADTEIYAEMGDALGIDFGTWPDFFYTGAKGDGRVFAVMSVDPFGVGPSQTILSVVYRFSRIGLPLLVWSVTLGNEMFVLPVVTAIGLLSVGAMGYFAGYLRPVLGWSAWFLVVNPALFIGFQGNTAEPIGLLLLTSVLFSSSGLLASALGATRPSYAVALFGNWRLLGLVGVTAVVVRALSVWRFGGPILGGPDDLFTLPMVGYVQQPSFSAWMVAFAALITISLGVRQRAWNWVVSGFLVLSFGVAILGEPVNMIRAAGFLPVLWAFGPSHRPGMRVTA